MAGNDWKNHNPMKQPGAAKRNSQNSPWRKQHFCKTQKALESRARLDAEDKA